MEPSEKIQAVSFDVGGTLIEPGPSVGHVYAEIAARHGLNRFTPEFLNQQFRVAWHTKADFDYSRRAWAQIVAKSFGVIDDALIDSKFFGQLYQRFAEPDAWRVYEDVVPALEMLAARGIKLAVVSNWDDRLRPLLMRLKLERYFAVVEVSVDGGFHKPASEIFRRAVDQLHVPAGSVLHIGDSPLEDVTGAKSAGLRALLLDRSQVPINGRQISALTELASFIR
jgi:putative hydrolase of the HAD superfamily